MEVSDVGAKNACVFVECEADERDDVHDVSPSVDVIIVHQKRGKGHGGLFSLTGRMMGWINA